LFNVVINNVIDDVINDAVNNDEDSDNNEDNGELAMIILIDLLPPVDLKFATQLKRRC
jgi:hypothetical protein